jgi:hypothetical protein
LDSTSNSAASDKGHTGALYSKNGDPAAGVGMALFTTTLGLYGGVLWSGEVQGFIVDEMMPSISISGLISAIRDWRLAIRLAIGGIGAAGSGWGGGSQLCDLRY